MDPLYEQRLRDEVIFLHSLWYQGPPRPSAAAAASSATRYHLRPSKAIHFKKDKKRKPNNVTHDSSSSHDAVWTCPPTPPPPTLWAAASGPTPEPLPLSPEEQSKLAAKDALQHALKVVREFFISNNADGFDEIDSSDDDDDVDDDDRLMYKDCGREVYHLFFKVFEDTKLREYYVKNFIVGEFSCLVCGAAGGKKTGKKFKGCLPLVQHSMSIEKTKRRRAHRALAQAVCKVLGWDIHNLPKIVSMLSDKSVNSQGNGNGDNKESSVAFVLNVDSVKGDEAEPASDSGKKLEDIGIVNTLCALEEPAPDGLTISFMACADADKTENQVGPRTTAVIASTSASVPILRHHLQPSAATEFKKKKKKKKKRKGKVGKKLADSAVTESISSHGAEWPCPSPPHLPSTSGWPTASWATLEKSSLKPALLSTEEQSMLAARHAHQNALKVVHEFFRKNNSDDSNEIDSVSDDDNDDDDEELMEEDSGSEEFSFFCKLFEEDKKLRACYMKSFAEGEFSCLVCGAVGGKNSGKKFKGCLPLLQHLITIAKTKKRKAHRAFGRTVCKVLGWDIDRLPTIESMLSDKTSETQISLTCVDANKNSENLEMVDQQSMDESASQGLTINSLVGPDADNKENLGMVHQVEQPASERSKSNLTCHDADRDLGNGNLHAHNLEDRIAGQLANVPSNEEEEESRGK